MVKVSYQQKPYRRMMMETWGGTCVASPSTETAAGRQILDQNPDSPGSLGIAISEAVEAAVQREDTKYALGSVLNHVMLHQTINGLECQKQMEIAGDYPDVVIGCAGGGSNFAGICLPYVRDKIHGKDIDIIGVEPTSCPTMTRGPFAYDFGDTVQMTPLLPMHTLGHTFVPEGIHAGGLRYHGMAPVISQLIMSNLIRPTAIPQLETFKAGITFARTEGFISAPETDHAVAETIRQALQAKEEGKEKVILFNWSGHGLVDMAAYEALSERKACRPRTGPGRHSAGFGRHRTTAQTQAVQGLIAPSSIRNALSPERTAGARYRRRRFFAPGAGFPINPNVYDLPRASGPPAGNRRLPCPPQQPLRGMISKSGAPGWDIKFTSHTAALKTTACPASKSLTAGTATFRWKHISKTTCPKPTGKRCSATR